MAQSTDAQLVGVYGLLRGLLGVLIGVGLAAEVAATESVIDAVGFAVGASLADAVTIIGVISLVFGIVLGAGAVGLFAEKGWGPIASVAGFGILGLLSIVALATAGIEIALLVVLVLDVIATGWAAREAPQIPIGGDRQQAQAA